LREPKRKDKNMRIIKILNKAYVKLEETMRKIEGKND